MTRVMAWSSSGRSRAYWAARSVSGTRTALDAHEPAVAQHVGGLAVGAVRRLRALGQALATAAGPAALRGRVAGDERVGRDVVGHDRAGADEGVLTDLDATDDRRVGADGHAAGDARLLVAVLARVLGARSRHVGEDRARTDEDVIADHDAVVERDVVLHADAVADGDGRGDEDVLPEDAAAPDARARRDVAEVPDLRVVSDERAVVDDGARVDVGGRHGPYHSPVRCAGERAMLGRACAT